jgi:hypothetical protein
VWWRNLTSRHRLTYRLVRDGFHALAILDDLTLVGAVPGALVTRFPNSGEFHVTHRVLRGTRPLHIALVPSGRIYWGEYFDNRERAEVHIYASADHGRTWEIAYTFPRGAIRHIHNIVYDRWGDCLWILTGDEGAECRILRASCDLRSVEVVLAGNQQARAVAALPTAQGLYFSTDTPFEQNHVYRLDRSGKLDQAGDLASSSIYGCKVSGAMFFSTMIEPSPGMKIVKFTLQVPGMVRTGRSWRAGKKTAFRRATSNTRMSSCPMAKTRLAIWRQPRWPSKAMTCSPRFGKLSRHDYSRALALLWAHLSSLPGPGTKPTDVLA